MVISLQQIQTVARCCRWHDIIRFVSHSSMHSYIKIPRKQNLFDVMPLYRRACTFNLSLHLLVMLTLLPQLSYTFSLYSWIRTNSSKTVGIIPLCYRRYVEPGSGAKNNATFSMLCFILLFISNITTWLSVLLLCAGDINPNPGPLPTPLIHIFKVKPFLMTQMPFFPTYHHPLTTHN